LIRIKSGLKWFKMGLRKKFINDEVTINWIKKNLPIEKLFMADILYIQGNISMKLYDLYCNDDVSLKHYISSISCDLGIITG
jgi:hypothetical protein